MSINIAFFYQTDELECWDDVYSGAKILVNSPFTFHGIGISPAFEMRNIHSRLFLLTKLCPCGKPRKNLSYIKKSYVLVKTGI